MNASSLTDFHRPSYHFLPAANWMNDPNGVIQWNGRYHLFYQYNPDGAYHANMHWGHAVSDDLLHWQELPVAIAPTPDSPDQGGIFSGSTVDDKGTPTAFYTGVNDDYTVQVQCLATGNDDLTRWEKYAGNPVIGEVPPEMEQTEEFRDPYVWRSDEGWYMTVGSRIAGIGGAVLLYRSSNLRDWEYLNPLFVGQRARNAYMFECPNFFPLDDKWVLIISAQFINHQRSTMLYYVGRFENHRFIPESEGVFDSGRAYASLTHVDEQGRRLLYSWLREERDVAAQREAGWSGVQAIPRVLSLDGRGRLCSQPVPEFKTLRHSHQSYQAGELDAERLPIGGLALDIEAELDVTAGVCGLEVAVAPQGEEKTAILYEPSTQTLRIQRRYDPDVPHIDSALQGLTHPLDDGEKLQLRILLDGSVLEVIANQRTNITSRIYPSQPQNSGLRLVNPAAMQRLDVWKVSSIWS